MSATKKVRTDVAFYLGLVYFVIGTLICCDFFRRRNRHPIRDRSPILILVSAISNVLCLTYFAVKQKFFPYQGCPDYFYLSYMLFTLMLVPYILRCVRLYLAYYFYSDPDKPSAADDTRRGKSLEWISDRWRKRLLSEKFHLVVLLVFSLIVLSILFSVNMIMHEEFNERQNKCLRNTGKAINGIVAAVSFFILVLMISMWFLRGVHDEFNINREIQVVCVGTAICSIVFFGFQFSGNGWPGEPYQLYAIAIAVAFCLAVSVFCPLLVSYSRRRRASSQGLQRKYDLLEPHRGSIPPTEKLLFRPFEEVMGDHELKPVFVRFMSRSFVLPILRFWEEIQDFKALSGDSQLARKGEQVVSKFLTAEGHMEVNCDGITERMRSTLFASMQSGTFRKDIFDDVEQVLHQMLASEYLDRFLRSNTYRKWRKQRRKSDWWRDRIRHKPGMSHADP